MLDTAHKYSSPAWQPRQCAATVPQTDISPCTEVQTEGLPRMEKGQILSENSSFVYSTTLPMPVESGGLSQYETLPPSKNRAFLLNCADHTAPRAPSETTMTIPESSTFIIIGVTKDGKKFRPSDWAERLCGVMSAFGAEKKMKYSPYVGPGDYNGDKAVFVDGRLNEVEPMAYRFVVNFAQDNDLQILDGVCSLDKKPT
jgi:hypothetical protein